MNEIILSENSGKIHAAELGDKKSDVVNRMKAHIVSQMPDEITARVPLDIKDSTFCEIDYDFTRGRLNSIDLDIYPKSRTDCDELFKHFKSHYNSTFGAGQEKDDFMVWYTISKTGKDVEIMMMNESKSHQKPYLAITFYQEENISI